MKYLSLFSGIGGFELGIKQAYETRSNRSLGDRKQLSKATNLQQKQNSTNSSGKLGDRWWKCPKCIGYSEIDKYAIQIYKKHFNHKNYGDITKINAKELPNFDFLCGGFPCQSFSIAGKRRGFEDTRGTLFFDIARIISEKSPSLLLLENVKGLLSHEKGDTFKTIIRTLDELGYDTEWQVLNSKNFGVPQNRERVFIIGHLRGKSRPKVFPIGESNKKINRECKTQNIQDREKTRTNAADKDYAICITAQQREGSRQINHIKVIEQLNQPKHSNDRVYSDKGLSPTINTMQGGNRQPFIRNPYNGKQSTKETGTLGTTCGTTTGKTAQHLYKDSKIRRLTPKECERLQGFPDDWTKTGTELGISDTQRYKTLGNAVTVNVVEEIIKKLKIK